MGTPDEKNKRTTKKEHVDEEKNKDAYKAKNTDAAGRDWTKPRFFGEKGKV